MTTPIRTRFAQFTGVALALFASSAVAAAVAQTPPSDRPTVAVVVGGEAAERPEVVAEATARARQLNAPLRVVRSSADEVGATHVLAARGYDKVITVGVDRRTAIAPVAQRYPGTEFVAVAPGALGAYL